MAVMLGLGMFVLIGMAVGGVQLLIDRWRRRTDRWADLH